MKLNVKKIAVILAVVWGLYVLLIGWLGAAGWGNQFLINIFSVIYVGFSPTFIGGIIGGVWGALDGLIAGIVIANLYNHVFSRSSHHF